MCGGTLEIATCSHVGHVFRKSTPYTFPGGTSKIVNHNNARLAEVWLDQWKYFYYNINPGSTNTRATKSLRVWLCYYDGLCPPLGGAMAFWEKIVTRVYKYIYVPHPTCVLYSSSMHVHPRSLVNRYNYCLCHTLIFFFSFLSVYTHPLYCLHPLGIFFIWHMAHLPTRELYNVFSFLHSFRRYGK